MVDSSSVQKIAVIGATGLVGGAVVERLEKEGFESEQIGLFATEESVGTRVDFGEGGLWVEALDKADFTQFALVIFAVPSEVSLQYVEQALEAGCKVIDSSQAYWQSDYPLLSGNQESDLPDSSVYVAPHPIAFLIERLVSAISKDAYIQRAQVNGLMPISSLGKKGAKELAGQTVSLLSGKPPEGGVLGHQLAFNVIPFEADSGEDSALEENVAAYQAKRLCNDDLLPLGISLVYVPVFFGASCFVELEVASELELEEVRSLLDADPWLSVSRQGEVLTPVADAAMGEQIYVGKISTDSESAYRISLWSVFDNVKVAAAQNIVMACKLLLKRFQ